jgi:CubicO group peptidase (beta-lactamase class C family)
VADYADRVLPGRTTYYYMRGDKLTEAGPVDSSYKWAGGGFLSTATDLALFGSAHLEPGFLQEETLALLFEPQVTSSGASTGYGIGWNVWSRGAEDGGPEYGHGGGSVGGSRYWCCSTGAGTRRPCTADNAATRSSVPTAVCR